MFDLFDTPIDRTSEIKIPKEYHVGGTEMTPKEALKGISNAHWDLSGHNFEITKLYARGTEEYKVLENAITELEELKRVVKEFMDLQLHATFDVYEAKMFLELKSKLMKVGREE